MKCLPSLLLLSFMFGWNLFSSWSVKDSCVPGVNGQHQQATMLNKDPDTVLLAGQIIKKPFVNKIGIASDSIYDVFLQTADAKYFIKSCEGNYAKSELEKRINTMVLVYGTIKTGNLDYCEVDELYQARGGTYLALDIMYGTSNEEIYQYTDGSGNQYTIRYDSIRYDPVKPAFSSSGMYDGGEPATTSITPETYREIAVRLASLFSLKDLHIKERIKTSGQVTMMHGTKKATVILKASSELEALEKALKQLL